jgi:uncharacterized protein YcbK (DUF882 family)
MKDRKFRHTVLPHRRSVLAKVGTALLATSLKPAFASNASPGARSIDLHNIHTGEHLSVDYWADGAYVPDALAAINKILRDFRTGDIQPIETNLLDTLVRLHGKLDTRKPFEVISGYRSPATNAALHARSEESGVAVKSLHMQGMAVDIRVPGRPLILLRNAALSERAGGVGYYPQSDFVHVDVGRVRRW